MNLTLLRLVLVGVAACSPVHPPTTGGSATNTTTEPSADTSTTSTTGATLETSTTTDAASTLSGATTMETPSPTSWTTDPGDDTTDGFVCNWQSDPDVKGFCPLLAGPNANISGTTPLGPIAFEYAYFGLYPCADCPFAADGQLAFFGEPDGPMAPMSDHLLASNHLAPALALSHGGEGLAVDGFDEGNEVIIVYMDVDIPSVAETNPPLDPNVPPTLSGKLSITGGGWDVSGEFTATLCRQFDLKINCA